MDGRRATDFSFQLVVDVLAEEGMILDSTKRSALAREQVQRSRLVRDRGKRPARGRRREISPIELVASFAFCDARRPNESIDEDKVTEAVARAVGAPYRKIDRLKLDATLVTRTLSRPFARRHGVLPLERTERELHVAVANPFDRELLEDLRTITRSEVVPILSSPSDIDRAITEDRRGAVVEDVRGADQGAARVGEGEGEDGGDGEGGFGLVSTGGVTRQAFFRRGRFFVAAGGDLAGLALGVGGFASCSTRSTIRSRSMARFQTVVVECASAESAASISSAFFFRGPPPVDSRRALRQRSGERNVSVN